MIPLLLQNCSVGAIGLSNARLDCAMGIIALKQEPAVLACCGRTQGQGGSHALRTAAQARQIPLELGQGTCRGQSEPVQP